MAEKDITIHINAKDQSAAVFRALKDHVNSFSESARGSLAGITEKFKGLAEFAGLGAAFEIGRSAIEGLGDAFKDMTREGFETADRIEKTQAALVGLAGSAENAKAIIAQLKEVASTPPFGFDEVAAAEKTLLSAGVAANQAVAIIKNMGDVSVGTGASLESLTEIFSRAATEGKVSGRALTESYRMGIPITAALAKTMGVAQDKIQDLANKGQISFADLQRAFQSMSAAGGRFNGLAAAQANTLGGLWGTLKTKLSFAFADIADQITEVFDLKGIIRKMTDALPRIEAFVTNAISTIAPYIDEISEKVKEVTTNIYEWVKTHWGAIVKITGDVMATVYSIFSGAFAAISELVATVWTAISSIWSAGVNWLTGGSKDAAGNTTKSFGDMATAVMGFFDDIAAKIANWRNALTADVSYVLLQLARLKDFATNGEALKNENLQRSKGRSQVVADFYKKHLGMKDQDATYGTTEDSRFEMIRKNYGREHPNMANPYDSLERRTESSDVIAAAKGYGQAQNNYAAGVAKTLVDQQAARDKVHNLVAKIMGNPFKDLKANMPKLPSAQDMAGATGLGAETKAPDVETKKSEHIFHFEQSRFLTGITAAAKMQSPKMQSPELKAANKGNTILTAISSALTGINESLRNPAVRAGLGAGGWSYA